MKHGKDNRDDARIYFPFQEDSIERLYRRFRAQGELSRWALIQAKTVKEFHAGESDLLRLVAIPDECADFDDLCGDCYDPKVNSDIPRARLERERKEFLDKVNREGVYGLVGEYRVSQDSPWIEADSCWGFVGTDNIGNSDSAFGGYEFDVMRQTIDALKTALCNCASIR